MTSRGCESETRLELAFEVALEAARFLALTPRLVLKTTADVVMKARRPRYCALSNRKLQAAGWTMPAWQDALARWLATRRQSAT